MAENSSADTGTMVKGSVAHMRHIMEMEASLPEVTDVRQISEGIQQRVLDALTDDEVFAAGNAGLLSGKDAMVDMPIAVLGYRFNKSGYEDGLPVYAVVEARHLLSGETVLFSLGSETAVTQLFKFESLKPFTQRPEGLACALRSKTTNSGNDVLSFSPLTETERKAAGLK